MGKQIDSKILIVIIFLLIILSGVLFYITIRPLNELKNNQSLFRKYNTGRVSPSLMHINKETLDEWKKEYNESPKITSFKVQAKVSRVNKGNTCNNFVLIIKAVKPIRADYKENYNTEVIMNSCENFNEGSIINCFINVITKKASTSIDFIEYNCPSLKTDAVKHYVK